MNAQKEQILTYQAPHENLDIRYFLDDEMMATVESSVHDQAMNTARTPGVEHVCVLPDCHSGYGAPIGSVVVSTDRVIPGPVGFDIGCGMAQYLTDIHADDLKSRELRRQIMSAIDRGIAMGAGKQATHGIDLTDDLVIDVLNFGAYVLAQQGIVPAAWLDHCERARHRFVPPGVVEMGRDRDNDFAGGRFTLGEIPDKALRGFKQLGSLGGGNHFIELQRVELPADESLRAVASEWGMFDGQLAIMVHSGSRGFGHGCGQWAFEAFKAANDAASEVYHDKELVHASVGSPLGTQYMRLVAAGANFALANRLLMAKVVKAAVEDVAPNANVQLLYEISHNLAQWEPDGEGNLRLVHRKGTTRAFPAGHPFLSDTRWAATGHPIITPGSMGDYSAIQVGLDGAAASFYSINHGAGRRLSRSAARKMLDQAEINAFMDERDILVNQRDVPLDEAPPAYKPMDDVLRSVRSFGLAAVVAKCHPIGSMKGGEDQVRKWK